MNSTANISPLVPASLPSKLSDAYTYIRDFNSSDVIVSAYLFEISCENTFDIDISRTIKLNFFIVIFFGFYFIFYTIP